MTDQPIAGQVSVDAVETVLADGGFDVSRTAENTLKIQDTESGINVRAVLEDNVLFLTVACVAVPNKTITSQIMKKMLDADNGISTSGFQLYERGDGKVAVTLNNFCKLQAMGADDEDDILSCLEFLLVDAVEARDLLSDLGS